MKVRGLISHNALTIVFMLSFITAMSLCMHKSEEIFSETGGAVAVGIEWTCRLSVQWYFEILWISSTNFGSPTDRSLAQVHCSDAVGNCKLEEQIRTAKRFCEVESSGICPSQFHISEGVNGASVRSCDSFPLRQIVF